MKLVELFGVQDTYCSGLGSVEVLTGGAVRFTLYVEKQDSEGFTSNVVVANIIMPVSSVPDAILRAATVVQICSREPLAVVDAAAHH